MLLLETNGTTMTLISKDLLFLLPLCGLILCFPLFIQKEAENIKERQNISTESSRRQIDGTTSRFFRFLPLNLRVCLFIGFWYRISNPIKFYLFSTQFLMHNQSYISRFLIIILSIQLNLLSLLYALSPYFTHNF